MALSKAERYEQKLADVVRSTGESLDIGEIVETEKWGQLAFLPKKPRTGTTVRIGQISENEVAMYVHCRTTLVDTYRAMFPHLNYEGNRAVVFNTAKPLPVGDIRICVEAAFTYHLAKRQGTPKSART